MICGVHMAESLLVGRNFVIDTAIAELTRLIQYTLRKKKIMSVTFNCFYYYRIKLRANRSTLGLFCLRPKRDRDVNS